MQALHPGRGGLFHLRRSCPRTTRAFPKWCIERAQRLVEMRQGRGDPAGLASRAWRAPITWSSRPPGSSLSGGLDPGALHQARSASSARRATSKHGGSLTIIATALVETGSRMDDVIYEEFKGTGNMELHLDRKTVRKAHLPSHRSCSNRARATRSCCSPEARLDGVACRAQGAVLAPALADATEQLMGMLERTKTNGEFFQRL